ncbi:MAG: WxL domain-containing protein [Solirubrobacteraceae bacterium]|nr:WxL domain-containing protein [Solirubrobacteraceae bacterium]
MSHRRIVATCLFASLFAAGTASAATGTATVTGGTLSFINSTPANVTFPGVTLNGSDQTVAQTQALDISDGTGSAAGWNVTATSTLFTSGANTLPAGSTTLASTPSVACDPSVSCTVASPTGMTYPYTLPSAAVAPPATKMYNAAAATGLGAQTVTPNWQLTVPASAIPGTYTSTWTFSLVSGP